MSPVKLRGSVAGGLICLLLGCPLLGYPSVAIDRITPPPPVITPELAALLPTAVTIPTVPATTQTSVATDPLGQWVLDAHRGLASEKGPFPLPDPGIVGSTVACLAGDCGDPTYTPATDFAHSQSQLAAVMTASVDHGAIAQQNPSTLRLFPGNAYACHDTAAHYNNCCRFTGWGQDVGLAGCSSAENTLATFRQQGRCLALGTYCAKKVVGHCVKTKQRFCCFGSPLAQAIQAQGRAQLKRNFGSAKHPDCSGLTVDQFQQLKLSAMDFSAVEAAMMAKANTVDPTRLHQRVTESLITSSTESVDDTP